MLKNHLKIIRRQIARQPAYAILNLSCLTFGIAAALLILMYLNFELNYDASHENADRIYRVETNAIETKDKVMEVNWRSTPAALGPYLKKDYAEIEACTRLWWFYRNEVISFDVEGKVTETDNMVIADSSVFDVFTFDFIHGDQNTAMNGPNKIVLSESLSKQMFGAENPIGKIMKTSLIHTRPDVDPDYVFVVSGVFKDLPENSHINVNSLLSAESDPELANYYFKRFTYYTYALVNENADTEVLAAKFTDVYTNYLDPNLEPVMKKAFHELVPLRSIHMRLTGGSTYAYIFGAVGFLLLLIAMISYVNMVTAQASKRAMEIGLRKVMGSSRQQLILQFLTESFFFSALALILAVGLVLLTIYPMNEMLGLQLSAAHLIQGKVIGGMFVILLLLGLFGGSYPAFFLSAFQPIAVMKGKLTKGAPVRKALVAVQFAVVIFVLVSTGMIYEQLQYLGEKDLGFNRDQIIQLTFPSEAERSKMEVLKEEMKKNPNVTSVGSSSLLPGVSMPRRPLSADGSSSQESQFVYFGRIGYDFLETMDMEVIAGRNFSTAHPKDNEESILVNEQMAKSFGLENPIGERVRYGDKGNPNFVTIVGVIKDFHQNDLHNEIAPQIFLLEPVSHNMVIKVSDDISTGLAQVEKSWNKIFPTAPFEYHFLDDEIQLGYETDLVRGQIFLMFSLLTIFIAFLGLFGLASYNTKRRVKEIGIRKVLGASAMNIVLLIARDFLLLVAVAAIPAFVIAWFFINGWLEDFAYRTEMNYLVFVVVLLFTLLLTFVTTSLHAGKAAGTNPAETLKYE